VKVVYVVTMYRWGKRSNHSYILGVYHKKNKAIKSAEREQVERGGNKYYPEILRFNMDENITERKPKTVLRLKKNPEISN